MARRLPRRFTLESLEPRSLLAGDLLISEFMAYNTNDPGNLRDADGDSSDWIEIYNPTAAAVDLDGWHLTDDPADLDLWTFPPRIIGPNSHLIVFASNKDRTGPELHTSFELNGLGEYLALVRPDLSIAHQYDPKFPQQLNDISYGMADLPANVTTLVSAATPAEVLIPNAAEDGANWTAADYDASGWAATGRSMTGPQGIGFELAPPAFTSLLDIGAIGGRLEPGSDGGGEIGAGVHNTNATNLATRSITASTGQTYSIAIDNVNAAGTAVGGIDWRDRGDSTNGAQPLVQLAEDHVKNVSGIVRVTLAGLPAGSYTLTSYHVDADNSQCAAIRILVNSGGGYADTGVLANASYPGGVDPGASGENALTTAIVQAHSATFVVTSDGVNPVRIVFDGTAAADIEVPLSGLKIDNGGGVFASSIGTDTESLQYAQNASAWIRLPFSYGGGAAIDQMTLRMKYDAGFVAYLNGTEIARRNAPGTAPAPLAFDAAATASRSDAQALVYESIDVTGAASLLFTNDTNVLAIHGLNESAGDDDFLISAELTTSSVTPGILQYFTTPTPGLANIPGTIGFVADTKFNVDRGFYTAPIAVEITSQTPGAEIRYTTDGSAPTATTGSVYTGPITISRTTMLRAAAFKPGLTPTNVDTQTYFFLSNVLTQTGAGLPAYAPWGHAGADWEVDPDITGNAVVSNRLTTSDLKSVPTISLVTNWNDMFGAGGQGIYIAGAGREVPASIEMINPDGTTRFQINGSTEIQGGTSDDRWKDDKLSQQLKFKAPYGPTKLHANIFGPGTTESFDTLILDGVLNWSWVHTTSDPQREGAKYIQDQYVADLQNATGGFGPHGIFTHLYIDGLYWGMYYLHERPDQTFASDYLGGDKDEYNVIKHTATTIVHNATNNPAGVTASTDYSSMVALAAADLSIDANYRAVAAKLDIDNFINYILVNWYVGNDDWAYKNWYASRRQSPDGKWRFHSWDAEHVLKNVSLNPITGNSNGNSPSGLHERLKLNAEYRQKFADHAYKLLVQPGGVLTTPVATAMYQARMAEVDRAIVGESARWGDNSETIAKTRADWLNTQNALLTSYFPVRTSNVLSYLRAAGLYPTIDAPIYAQQGGEVADGFALSMSDPNNPAGAIYYTTDGSDPSVPITASPITLLPEFSPVRVFVPTDNSLGTTWTAPAFDDSTWLAGTAGVGYDRDPTGVNFYNVGGVNLVGVNVEAQMYGINPSVYTRFEFNVADPSLLSSLSLQIKNDDGFIAYLNGFEVTRRLAPTSSTWNSAAQLPTPDATAIAFQNFDITAHLGRLVAGRNVLAIQGMTNVSGTNNVDLLVSPQLVGTRTTGTGIAPTAQQYTGPVALFDTSTVKSRIRRTGTWSAMAEAFFTVDEPVRVSELYYNPPGNSESTEFIELLNISGGPVDLTGFKFVRDDNGVGIDYEFLPTDTNRTLPAGGRMVLVQDRAAFAAQFPWVPASAIADRVYTGNLDNAGETITLFDRGGGVLQRFTYDDVWYDSTDGDGYSLVVVDTSAAKTTWNVSTGWQPSRELGGSPGEPDYLRGDFNGDNRVDIHDLAILQSHQGLFSVITHDQGDMNRDGTVNRDDVVLFLANLGHVYPPPAVPSPVAAPSAVIARSLATPARGNAVDRALATVRAPRVARQPAVIEAISMGRLSESASLEGNGRTLRARRAPRSEVAASRGHDAAFAEIFQ